MLYKIVKSIPPIPVSYHHLSAAGLACRSAGQCKYAACMLCSSLLLQSPFVPVLTSEGQHPMPAQCDMCDLV